jgi:hypothetical protein
LIAAGAKTYSFQKAMALRISFVSFFGQGGGGGALKNSHAARTRSHPTKPAKKTDCTKQHYNKTTNKQKNTNKHKIRSLTLQTKLNHPQRTLKNKPLIVP